MKSFSQFITEKQNSNNIEHKHTLICPSNSLDDTNNLGKCWKVFLAGPIQGAPNWQHSVETLFMNEQQNNKIVFLSPRRLNYDNFNYEEQVQWEKKYMGLADVILFWIPEASEDIKGRSYAQTTRTEFGEYLARGKKIIFGTYKEFPGLRYFESKFKQYYGDNYQIHSSLEDCLKEMNDYISSSKPTTYFISDTHFGDSRALELSKRPYNSVTRMDDDMIMKWNMTVKPNDTVYHLGDLGDNLDFICNLNGTKYFLEGNYERYVKYSYNVNDFDKVFKEPSIIDVNDKKYVISHEPTSGATLKNQNPDVEGVIFGHIHGRQKIKTFGVDAGVDANNFKPISIDEIDFYLNAIKKGYYDKEVWS